MNNSKFVGKLDTKNKDDIAAMEEVLKAKYDNKNSKKPKESDNKEAVSA